MSKIAKTTDRRLAPVESLFGERADQLQQVLPDHVTPERFVRVLASAALQNPELNRIASGPADGQRALFTEALKCASDGLLPDGREAALVAFKGRVSYIPMIGGVLKRVMASGDVTSIDAQVVYEEDEFEYRLEGTERILRHQPTLRGPRGEMIGVYAYATLANGGAFHEYMTAEDVAHVQKSASGSNSRSSPWQAHTPQMWRKTVLHRLAKRLPMSSESMRVIGRVEQHYDFDEPEAAPQRATAVPNEFAALDSAHEPADAEIINTNEVPECLQ